MLPSSSPEDGKIMNNGSTYLYVVSRPMRETGGRKPDAFGQAPSSSFFSLLSSSSLPSQSFNPRTRLGHLR